MSRAIAPTAAPVGTVSAAALIVRSGLSPADLHTRGLELVALLLEAPELRTVGELRFSRLPGPPSRCQGCGTASGKGHGLATVLAVWRSRPPMQRLETGLEQCRDCGHTYSLQAMSPAHDLALKTYLTTKGRLT